MSILTSTVINTVLGYYIHKGKIHNNNVKDKFEVSSFYKKINEVLQQKIKNPPFHHFLLLNETMSNEAMTVIIKDDIYSTIKYTIWGSSPYTKVTGFLFQMYGKISNRIYLMYGKMMFLYNDQKRENKDDFIDYSQTYDVETIWTDENQNIEINFLIPEDQIQLQIYD
jgi:hypothetical protein